MINTSNRFSLLQTQGSIAMSGYTTGATIGGFGKRPSSQQYGQKTTLIYGFLRDGRYADAIKQLQTELDTHSRSRPALSLMAYANYLQQDFHAASECYEKLIRYWPECDEYRLYYAQCLYKADLLTEASRATAQIDGYPSELIKLQASIAYASADLQSTKSYIERLPEEDIDTLISNANVHYMVGQFEQALHIYQQALDSGGYAPDVAYNIAACYYQLKSFAPCLQYLSEIIERGVREHPELSVGSNGEGVEVRSVGNSQTLKDTMLVEAFNLKAAVEFQLKNFDAAKEALLDMPPRDEAELDSVTLANQALLNMDTDPTGGFRKFDFLLKSDSFPLETFSNLLILLVKFGFYDRAADILADYTHLHQTHLSEELYEFIEAVILTQSSPDEAYRKLDILSTKHVEILRKLTKLIQDARLQDSDAIKDALKQYDEALEKYMPVLMTQARIYWDLENYPMVEKLFKQSAEFCSEHEVWKLNVAHVFFMQENKFKDAIRYYEPIVQKHAGALLNVTAIVLANLCVSFIMTTQNEAAEELMRQIEKEEEQLADAHPEKSSYHLCIVNLVIGTLYCSKGQFEFGISRIIKSLEPYDKKIGPDTWHYAKRCFLALGEICAKHMMVLKDEFLFEIMAFLDQAEAHGHDVHTLLAQQGVTIDPALHNVSHEARLIKKLFYELRE